MSLKATSPVINSEDIKNTELEQQQQQEPYPQLQENVFTDLNLLISDDDLPSNDNEEIEHDSCLENVKFYLSFEMEIAYFVVIKRNRQLNSVMVHCKIMTTSK